jgi:hypothetical protein
VAPVPGHHARAVGAAWALAVLSALSAIVFAAAAVAGWALHLWPATPVTLGVAAGFVVGGPLISALLLRRVTSPKAGACDGLAGETRFREPQPRLPQPQPRLPQPQHPLPQPQPRLPQPQQRLPQPPPRPLTPDQAWGRALLEWRERPFRRS